MTTEELKKVQAPLKDKYRTSPEMALVTLEAKGNIGESISCKIDTGKKLVEAGLHEATGGDGMLACSGDLLLEALVACAGVTLRAVSISLGIPVVGGSILAEGDLDFKGTMAVSKESPVGFQEIRLFFNIQTDASKEDIDTLIKLTKRYCVVYQTILQSTKTEMFINA